MTRSTKRAGVAALAAAVIAASGFAAAQIWGEGAGMPLVILASTLWTAAFVSRAARSGNADK
jgi:hypothetical protein